MKTEAFGWEWRSRRVWLAFALVYTVLPIISLFIGGHLAWLRDITAARTWGSRVFLWSLAAFFWILYFIRVRRRDVPLALAIVVTLLESVAVLSRANILTTFTGRANYAELILIGALAALCWIWHFWERALARQ
jgi:hypothetical protein